MAARVAVASSLLTRGACAGSASQAPTRAETWARMTLSRTTSADRKFEATNDSRLWPSASLRVGMIAVCGMGSPSGRSEQRRHGEPVGEAADHRRLGSGVDEADARRRDGG